MATTSTARPHVSSWWRDSASTSKNPVWMRYFGRCNARVRKLRPGAYEYTVTTPENGTVHEGMAGTSASAKSKADQWLLNNEGGMRHR